MIYTAPTEIEHYLYPHSLTEALPICGVVDHLADRLQRQLGGAAGGALGQRVEAPQALQVVAEEVEAQRLLLAWRENVDDAAAHRELAGLADGLDAVVAVPGEAAVEALGGRIGRAAWRERVGQ